MSFKAQAITIIPALLVFVLAIYLAIFSSIITDPALKQQSLILASALFFCGLVMAVCWAFYWAIAKTHVIPTQFLKNGSK